MIQSHKTHHKWLPELEEDPNTISEWNKCLGACAKLLQELYSQPSGNHRYLISCSNSHWIYPTMPPSPTKKTDTVIHHSLHQYIRFTMFSPPNVEVCPFFSGPRHDCFQRRNWYKSRSPEIQGDARKSLNAQLPEGCFWNKLCLYIYIYKQVLVWNIGKYTVYQYIIM